MFIWGTSLFSNSVTLSEHSDQIMFCVGVACVCFNYNKIIIDFVERRTSWSMRKILVLTVSKGRWTIQCHWYKSQTAKASTWGWNETTRTWEWSHNIWRSGADNWTQNRRLIVWRSASPRVRRLSQRIYQRVRLNFCSTKSSQKLIPTNNVYKYIEIYSFLQGLLGYWHASPEHTHTHTHIKILVVRL